MFFLFPGRGPFLSSLFHHGWVWWQRHLGISLGAWSRAAGVCGLAMCPGRASFSFVAWLGNEKDRRIVELVGEGG